MKLDNTIAVYCSNTDEVGQVLTLFYTHGIVYWPHRTWESLDDYINELSVYPYIECSSRSGSLELVGNHGKMSGVNYLSFTVFMSRYAQTKKAKIMERIKDFT